jgi:hypothetical protein
MDPRALSDALAIADAAPGVRAAAAALRERFAPMRVVVVDASDMRHETPAATGVLHQLWLGATDGHCWSVTSSVEQATGLFIAARS